MISSTLDLPGLGKIDTFWESWDCSYSAGFSSQDGGDEYFGKQGRYTIDIDNNSGWGKWKSRFFLKIILSK